MKIDFSLAAVLKGEYGAKLLHGIVLTIELTLAAAFIAIVLGLALATLRMTKNRVAVGLVATYVAYHRNVPMLVQLMMWYFAIPTLLPPSLQQAINGLNGEFVFAAVAVGLCMAAYVSEDIRSGLRTVPHGQFEASRALGHGFMGSMRHVIVPQAMRISIPPLVNHAVLLMKNTSLGMAIGVAELTYASREVENATFRAFEAYFVATVIYMAFSLLIMAAGARIAKHYRIPGTR